MILAPSGASGAAERLDVTLALIKGDRSSRKVRRDPGSIETVRSSGKVRRDPGSHQGRQEQQKGET